jgi:hypothetical protein
MPARRTRPDGIRIIIDRFGAASLISTLALENNTPNPGHAGDRRRL